MKKKEEDFDKFVQECTKRWNLVYQGGNMWASFDCFLTAARDILGLKLKEHEKYKFWEESAIHGGFRVMHEEFCIVSDFPERILVDDQNRPHCEDGPSHKWRDGWALYHWHGVSLPNKDWIEKKDSLTVEEVFRQTNAEVRRAGCEILGWDKIFKQLKAKKLDEDGDPMIGSLYNGTLPGNVQCGFLKVLCGTGREFVIPVPPTIRTAIEAQAWIQNVPIAKWEKPEVRG